MMDTFRRRLRYRSKVARATRACLMAPDGQTLTRSAAVLLADLRVFCCADTSCVAIAKDGHIDVHATMVAEGRREVWARLHEHLNLNDQAVRDIEEAHHVD